MLPDPRDGDPLYTPGPDPEPTWRLRIRTPDDYDAAGLPLRWTSVATGPVGRSHTYTTKGMAVYLDFTDPLPEPRGGCCLALLLAVVSAGVVAGVVWWVVLR